MSFECSFMIEISNRHIVNLFRDSSSPIKRENHADSDDSTDSEDELSSPKIIPQQPSTEKMEIDSTEGRSKYDP